MSPVLLRCVDQLIFYLYLVGNNSLYPSMQYYLPLCFRGGVRNHLWLHICSRSLWLNAPGHSAKYHISGTKLLLKNYQSRIYQTYVFLNNKLNSFVVDLLQLSKATCCFDVLFSKVFKSPFKRIKNTLVSFAIYCISKAIVQFFIYFAPYLVSQTILRHR